MGGGGGLGGVCVLGGGLIFIYKIYLMGFFIIIYINI